MGDFRDGVHRLPVPLELVVLLPSPVDFSPLNHPGLFPRTRHPLRVPTPTIGRIHLQALSLNHSTQCRVPVISSNISLPSESNPSSSRFISQHLAFLIPPLMAFTSPSLTFAANHPITSEHFLSSLGVRVWASHPSTRSDLPAVPALLPDSIQVHQLTFPQPSIDQETTTWGTPLG